MNSRFYRADEKGNFNEYINHAYENVRREREEQSRYEDREDKKAKEKIWEDYEHQRNRWKSGSQFSGWGNAFKANDDFKSGELNTDTIKAIFRKLSKKYHPDIGGSNEAMKALGEFKDKMIKIIEGSS